LFLLERSIALDPELGTHVDASVGRVDFVRSFIETGSPDPARSTAVGPWKAFVIGQVMRAADDDDLTEFIRVLEREPSLLGDDFVWLQSSLIAGAALNDREERIARLLDLNPAILRRQPPPPSQALEFAFTYANTHLIPLLSRIWPVPDDLPHAAGMGNLTRVEQWFDESGAPALGDPGHHYPYNDPRAREHLHWNPPTVQQVLDTALAYSVINRHFDVADFLLGHGANINTDWNSHEPASILHHLVFLQQGYESMQFLIDRGIDMTIKDYRWNSTARGWALYAVKDEKLAQWLEEAERRRE
jgi:ankyrin repeat protein